MENANIDLKTLDSDQIEVYNYLVDTVGYDEDYAYGIVNEYEYTLYDDFEDFVYNSIESCGVNIPDFVELDFVGMWLHTFAHYCSRYNFIDYPNFKRRPNCFYKDDPEFKHWEFYFLDIIKDSRFLEVHR